MGMGLRGTNTFFNKFVSSNYKNLLSEYQLSIHPSTQNYNQFLETVDSAMYYRHLKRKDKMSGLYTIPADKHIQFHSDNLNNLRQNFRIHIFTNKPGKKIVVRSNKKNWDKLTEVHVSIEDQNEYDNRDLYSHANVDFIVSHKIDFLNLGKMGWLVNEETWSKKWSIHFPYLSSEDITIQFSLLWNLMYSAICRHQIAFFKIAYFKM